MGLGDYSGNLSYERHSSGYLSHACGGNGPDHTHDFYNDPQWNSLYSVGIVGSGVHGPACPYQYFGSGSYYTLLLIFHHRPPATMLQYGFGFAEYHGRWNEPALDYL